jgi:hypothetical protein
VNCELHDGQLGSCLPDGKLGEDEFDAERRASKKHDTVAQLVEARPSVVDSSRAAMAKLGLLRRSIGCGEGR